MTAIFRCGIGDSDFRRITEISRITELFQAILIDQFFGFENIRKPVQCALCLRDGEGFALEQDDVIPVGDFSHVAAVLSAV